MIKGYDTVPTWMIENRRFVKDLTKCMYSKQVEEIILKHGINYVISYAQASSILTTKKIDEPLKATVLTAGKFIKIHSTFQDI